MRTKPIEPLEAAEFSRLVRAAGQDFWGLRDRALLEVLFKSQLRIAEALALRRSDYNDVASTLLVRCGKGGKQRLAVLHPSAGDALRAWIREKKGRGLGDPLFCSVRGRALNRANVRRTVRRLADLAGITKRVHPHGFRHSGARLLAASGVPMNVIQAQLGHASLNTTGLYLEVLCPAVRIKAITGVEL